MKTEMYVYTRSHGDGTFVASFYPTIIDLVTDFEDTFEGIDVDDDMTAYQNIYDWCLEDPYERGEISTVEIEIENGKIKPFFVSTYL